MFCFENKKIVFENNDQIERISSYILCKFIIFCF